MKKYLLFLIAVCLSFAMYGQTTLISPTGDGGFENGATPALNNWTALASGVDAWAVGATPTPTAGTNCGYISTDGGTTWTYSLISTIEHLYYDVTIPAGQPKVTLTFKWKAGGEGSTTSDWDNMKVFWGPSASITPAANTAISSGFQISGAGATNGMYKLNSAAWNAETIVVSGTPGTTYRLIFSWKSDVSDIANPPCAIDEVSLVSNVAGNVSSTALGGLWSSPATWVGGVLPAGDHVTIASGSTVVVNQSVSILDLTVDGKLQWLTTTSPSSTVNVLQAEDIYVSSTGEFYAHGTVSAGATVKVTGNFTNNGVANFAASGAGLTFNGTSGIQSLSGTGTFTADMLGRGMINNLLFTSLGSCDINTTQNLVTSNLAHTAGSLNTNGKLTIDNTAICFGGAINRRVTTVTVNNMGAGYTSAPTVAFTAAPAGGVTATGVANFDVATGTVRSITITNPGEGYRTAPTVTLTGGGYTTAATAVAALYQVFNYGTNSLGQKSAIASITGGLSIKSDQAVGSVWVTNGGVGYTAAPTVGFSLPTGYLNLVTAGGSGYASVPTVTLNGGGGTGAVATAVVTRGQVTSINITTAGTGYTSLPTITITSATGTGAAAEFPAGCLPAATANIDAALGMITSFTVTNGGFGYTAAPTVTLTGGTYTTAASGATSRLGLYNLTLSYFTPATSNPVHTESDFVPANRRINSLTFGSTAVGMNLTGNLELYGSSPLTLYGDMNMGGNTLSFSHPTYTGTSGSATAFVSNGKISFRLFGSTSSQTRTFPFNSYDAVGFVNSMLSTGSATTVLTEGCTVTSLTASLAGPPAATNMIGTRTLRLESNGLLGNSATLRMAYNSVDNLTALSNLFYISQATSLTGPWAIRSAATGTGYVAASGNRTTATAAPGPIVFTGNDYFGWEYDAPSCLPPSAGTTSTITTSSAILDWTNGASETLWNIKYGVGTFDPLTAGTLISGVNAHPYLLNPPLSPATAYTWYVQSDCGAGLTSSWSGPYSFTTLCETITTYPFTEDFSASMPCWIASEGSTGSAYHWGTTTGDGTHGVGSAQSGLGTYFAYLNVYNAQTTYNPYYYTTSSFTLDATAKRLKYYYWLGTSGNQLSPVPLTIQISTDGGTTWSEIYAHTSANSVFGTASTSPWTLNTISLAAYVGQTVKFRFVSQSNYGSGFCNQGIDTFVIEDIPSCLAPTTLTASVASTTANIGWTAGGTETAWEYVYGISPVAIPTGAGTATSTNPTSLSGLTAATTYQFYVRANCGSMFSEWAGPYTFTTNCDVAPLPYTMDFETAVVPGFPVCTSVQNAGSGNNWVTVSAPGSGFTTKALKYGYNGTYSANTWFYTQAVNLNGGTSYRISFNYGNNSTTYIEKLKVAYGTSAINTSMTNVIVDYPTINQNAIQSAIIDFTPVTTGTYYIGFNCYSDPDMWNLYVDNIALDITPACPPPTALSSVPSNFSAGISWLAGGTEGAWDVEWGATPYTFTGTPTLSLTSPGTTLTSLSASTQYTYKVRANCAGSYSNWVGPHTFTTLVACPPPTTLGASAITTTSAKLDWVETGTATAWDIELITTGGTFTGTPTVTGTNDNPYSVSSLSPGTSYSFKVRSSCSVSEQSTWAGPYTFTTLCEVVTSFSQNFDAVVVPALPPCWAKLGTTGLASTQASSAASSPNCLYIYGYSGSPNAMVTLPEVSNAGAGTHRLRFKLRGNFTAGDAIEVGYLTIPGDPASFVVLQSVTAAALTYSEVTVVPGTAPGTSTFLAFRHPGTLGYSILIDDVYWEAIPSCEFPTAVTASNITTTTADLSWTAPSSAPANGYEWEVRTSGAGGSGATGLVASGVTAAGVTSATATGLSAGTVYHTYVRSNCGAGGYSIWSDVSNFTTPLCEVVDQCNYTVDLTDAYGDGWNGAVLAFKQGGVIVGTFGTGFTTGSTYGPVSVPLCDALSTEIVVVTVGTYPEEVGFVVTDPFGNIVYTFVEGTSFTASTVFTTFTTACTIPAHDVTTLSIDMSSSIGEGAVIPVATVKNLGSNTETFDVTMTIGAYTSTKTVTGLTTFASQQVVFDTWTASIGNQTIEVCTDLATDVNTTNDCATLDVIVTAVGNGVWTNGAAFPTTVYLGTGVGYVDNSVSPAEGYLYSIGGNTASSLGTECYKYNTRTDTWTAIASLPAGRRVLASARVGTNIYAFGGSDMSSVYQTTVYKYDITANTWSTVTAMPLAIGWGKAVAVGTDVYFAGGVDASSNLLSSVYRYNTLTDTWTSATAMPGAKFGGAFSATGSTLVYAAGADDLGISDVVYVGSITAPDAISWTTAKNAYPGSTGPKVSSAAILSAEDMTITTTTNTNRASYPAGAMYRFDAAPWGTDGVIMAAGSPSSAWVPADPNPCYVYKPATDTWVMEPNLTTPVLGPSLGSCDLGDSWKLVVASGLGAGSVASSATQILTETFSKELNVNIFLEGLYAGAGTMNQAIGLSGPEYGAGIADKVTIELYDENDLAAAAYTFTDLDLMTTGDVSIPTVPAEVAGMFYIVVKHRNSMETWSATAVSFSDPSPIVYNFSTDATQAYGANMKVVGGVALIYAGDVNQDGIVDGSDMAAVDNASTATLLGYNPEDTNGDGIVDGSDMAIIDNNSTATVQISRP